MDKKDKETGKGQLGDEDKLFRQAMGFDSPSEGFEGPASTQEPCDVQPLDEGDSLFLQEMAGLTTVEAKEDSTKPIASEPIEKEQSPLAETVSPSFHQEDSLFVSAFEDHLPPSPVEVSREETTRSGESKVKWKAIQKGLMAPDATLDLHGYTEAQAQSALKQFLQKDARSHEIVLVIVGKGYRSKGLPVLSTALPEWLNKDFNQWIIEWKWAPRHLGGSGAALVKLRA